MVPVTIHSRVELVSHVTRMWPSVGRPRVGLTSVFSSAIDRPVCGGRVVTMISVAIDSWIELIGHVARMWTSIGRIIGSGKWIVGRGRGIVGKWVVVRGAYSVVGGRVVGEGVIMSAGRVRREWVARRSDGIISRQWIVVRYRIVVPVRVVGRLVAVRGWAANIRPCVVGVRGCQALAITMRDA
ncbi:hypothetical protein ES702_04135 [subsurface metagenome]